VKKIFIGELNLFYQAIRLQACGISILVSTTQAISFENKSVSFSNTNQINQHAFSCQLASG
jgi:hypothetical protein